MKPIDSINGIQVFPHSWRKPDNKINGTIADGMIFRFFRWARLNGVVDIEDDIEDVWNNFSGIRDGNRLDIMDNYHLEEDIEISDVYYVNGCTWAALIRDGSTYGDIEIA